MPASTDQLPRFDLPGAEYMSLAPNAMIAIGGRRQRNNKSVVVSIPLSAVGNVGVPAIQLESNFQLTSGIYLHDCYMAGISSDGSGQLQVLGGDVSLSSASGGVGFQIGTQLLNLTTPLGLAVFVRDRDRFITGWDVSNADALYGTGFANGLWLRGEVIFKNLDSAAAHTYQVGIAIVYTRLDGLTV